MSEAYDTNNQPKAPVLQLDCLSVVGGRQAATALVDGVTLRIDAQTTVGLVGESGCGKSMTALSITRLLPAGCRISSGKIFFSGEALTSVAERRLREIRGRDITYVFQEPGAALNPVLTVGSQIREVLLLHRPDIDAVARYDFVCAQLESVGLHPARRMYQAYPHQLSGGEKQRVMIAMALAATPQLVICDEPTTALDVTVQARILRLISSVQRQLRCALLFISHDLAIVAALADRIAVMYAGQVVETAATATLTAAPAHPYTQQLIACLPGRATGRGERLPTIEGDVPRCGAFPSGCRFHPRCPQVMPRCRIQAPEQRGLTAEHEVRCWRYCA